MKIKICGIKDLETAYFCTQQKVDFIGLNFSPTSIRLIEVPVAREICKNFSKAIKIVGLFVNITPTELNNLLDKVPLDYLQFHGEEPLELVKSVKQNYPDKKIIKAFKLSTLNDLDTFRSQKNNWGFVDHFLFDSAIGGSGREIDKEILNSAVKDNIFHNNFIAGGINIENVKIKINLTNPFAIDIASGVESSPGVKSLQKINEIVTMVRTNF